jgi:pimeloyl-ACP methyl ester carboxylesterase
MAREISEGRLRGGLPNLTFGEGQPLIVFPGLGMTNANPTGIQRWGELRLLAPLARVFTVHRISRRVGLASGTTMADLADAYAVALDGEFGEPVDVLGISTGGSVALQLAADRPELVSRLVVAGAAYRLSEYGRGFQRRTAELSTAGDRRGLSLMQAPDVTDSRLGQRIAGGLLWLAGPLFIKRDWNPSDMIVSIRAEDAFDIGGGLGEISAPTLVIGGGRDRFYPTELFRETAEGIPNARLIIYRDRAHGGTFADRRFGRDVVAFLLADQPSRASS